MVLFCFVLFLVVYLCNLHMSEGLFFKGYFFGLVCRLNYGWFEFRFVKASSDGAFHV